MLRLRTGLQLSSLRQPLRQALTTASRLGVEGVELNARTEIKVADMSRTAVRHFRKLLDDLNLKLVALHFPTRRGYNVAHDLEQRIDATKKAMSLAYELGASLVTNQIGELGDDPESSTWNLMRESLHALGQHGQICGAKLATRTEGDDPEKLKSFLDSLIHGTIGIDFDPAELIVNRNSPNEVMDHLAGHVFHFRARDGVQDLSRGRGIEVQLGRGSVDFHYLMSALEQHTYNGYFTIERRMAEDPLTEIADGVTYLKNLWE